MGGGGGLLVLVRTFSQRLLRESSLQEGKIPVMDPDLWPGMFLESPLRTRFNQDGAKPGLKNG